MNTVDSAELIRFANQQVLAKTAKPLNDVQERILEQVLIDRPRLLDIQVHGYSETTVQRVFCPKLWKLLSEVFGQEVRLNTVRLVLEKAYKISRQSIHPGSQPLLPGTSTVAPAPTAAPPSTRQIPHNLPASSCTAFIGREEELARLLELLSPQHAAPIISVDGIGGVGKTTLVVEAAYRCLQASCSDASASTVPTFDAIIFTSAKEFRLMPFGLLKSLAPRRTLNDIFRQITYVIEELDLAGVAFAEQLDLIRTTLARYRTLLIVDNLETVKDQQEVLAFLYELPPTVKAVITTREQIIFVPVRLTSMPESDGLSLIQHESQTKGVSLSLTDQMQLYQATGGIPVAISYAVGQLANGTPLREIVQKIGQSDGDVARFCFESSVQPLKQQPAYRLLLALALFPAPALQEALVQVAVPELEADQAEPDLAKLRGLSLVRQEHDRYSMLPLTREYALAELKVNPDFAQQSRERWITYYLQHSETYAQQDPSDWQGSTFVELEAEWQNLQAVMECCIEAERYEDCLQLWQNLKTYTQLRGRHISRLDCWTDRLIWTAWLIQAAEQRGDWSVVAQMMVDRAWTLIGLGKPAQLSEAEDLLTQVWHLRQHQDRAFQANLAKIIAVLYVQQQRFEDAQTWLEQASLLVEQAGLSEPDHQRQVLQIQYYQGEIWFKTGDYDQSKQLFEAALRTARELNWVRVVFMIENWIADIAIEQGNLEVAQTLLVEGLQVAEANQDRTRIAYYQHSLAKLARSQANYSEAVRWATEAQHSFEALGMLPEAEESQNLLQTLLAS
ncbi:MAG: AAA family ATPase [Elainella sp. C42_A2020_010]|nr:AAA family ATPase [Elainella sp. C42_A2020_010]